MSEYHYQRGLRGLSQGTLYEKDYKDYQDGKNERDLHYGGYDSYTEESQKDKDERWASEKEKAFEKANEEFAGIWIGLFLGFMALLGGIAVRWVLIFFGLTLPSYSIWIIPGLLFLFFFSMSITGYNQEYKKAEKKYGKRY